jgi:hypothetical protein
MSWEGIVAEGLVILLCGMDICTGTSLSNCPAKARGDSLEDESDRVVRKVNSVGCEDMVPDSSLKFGE